jgi:hypothetical protein
MAGRTSYTEILHTLDCDDNKLASNERNSDEHRKEVLPTQVRSKQSPTPHGGFRFESSPDKRRRPHFLRVACGYNFLPSIVLCFYLPFQGFLSPWPSIKSFFPLVYGRSRWYVSARIYLS